MSETDYLRLMLAWRIVTLVSALALVAITIKRLKTL